MRDLLLHAALYFFSRNLNDFGGVGRDEVLQRAEDCAQEALIAVMNHLSDFRGDSKFSTWAYKFAINFALMTARHERMKGVSLDELTFLDESTFFKGLMQDEASTVAPEQSALQGEIHEIIRDVIENELREKQRLGLMLTVQDIQNVADLLRPTYDRTDGRDGFVSLEVSPGLAHDTAGTVEEARRPSNCPGQAGRYGRYRTRRPALAR